MVAPSLNVPFSVFRALAGPCPSDPARSGPSELRPRGRSHPGAGRPERPGPAFGPRPAVLPAPVSRPPAAQSPTVRAGVYLGPDESANITQKGSGTLKLFHLIVPHKDDGE